MSYSFDMEITSPWDEFLNWTRGGWFNLDGTPTDPIPKDLVDKAIRWGSVGDEWDGTQAAIVALKDGRHVAWENVYGPTGSGFNEDAYGGHAMVYVVDTFEQAWSQVLGDEGRAACRRGR